MQNRELFALMFLCLIQSCFANFFLVAFFCLDMIDKQSRVEGFCERVTSFLASPLSIISYTFQELTENYLTLFVPSLWEGRISDCYIYLHMIFGARVSMGNYNTIVLQLAHFQKFCGITVFLISLHLKGLFSPARIHQASGRKFSQLPFVHKNSIVGYCFHFFLLILLVLYM